jgi:hypothetical protein
MEKKKRYDPERKANVAELTDLLNQLIEANESDMDIINKLIETYKSEYLFTVIAFAEDYIY